MNIKVYQLNDFDWYAGESLEACIQQAMKDFGLSRDEVVDESVVHELSDYELNHFTLIDEETGRKITFSEALQEMINAGEDFPCLFASTEC